MKNQPDIQKNQVSEDFQCAGAVNSRAQPLRNLCRFVATFAFVILAVLELRGVEDGVSPVLLSNKYKKISLVSSDVILAQILNPRTGQAIHEDMVILPLLPGESIDSSSGGLVTSTRVDSRFGILLSRTENGIKLERYVIFEFGTLIYDSTADLGANVRFQKVLFSNLSAIILKCQLPGKPRLQVKRFQMLRKGFLLFSGVNGSGLFGGGAFSSWCVGRISTVDMAGFIFDFGEQEHIIQFRPRLLRQGDVPDDEKDGYFGPVRNIPHNGVVQIPAFGPRGLYSQIAFLSGRRYWDHYFPSGNGYAVPNGVYGIFKTSPPGKTAQEGIGKDDNSAGPE